ncbi:pyridoxal phosphate-dependent transferase [Rhypophila decipiens]|uniref:Pyridoxal phosphate-dependent transferase n=1 Tax=Rhypophila decipiens TaxID=261697 RepID=A0AAN6YJ38_9PEZI|nr:pyridoxal phosphate-dependent transferase [Rhypophila decipiens]
MAYHHDGRDVGLRSTAGMASSDKAPPLDLSHHYSFVAKNRTPNEMKKYYKLFQIPGIGNIAGGLPNVRFFPFDTLEAQTAKPERWAPTPNYPEVGDDGFEELTSSSSSPSKSTGGDPQAPAKLAIPKILQETDITKKIDLETALQYGQAQGYPPLLKWVREFTRENLHPNVPYRDGPEVTLVCGSTDGFSKTLDLFVNAWNPAEHDIRDRPGLLCETIAYPGILNQSKPRGVQIVPVKHDGHGMLPTGEGSLEDVLENWDFEKGKRPHLLYTVTLGHNPSGIVLPMGRRKQLYDICSKYDVIIVEDEPYWYLQYPSAPVEEAKSRGQNPPEEEIAAQYYRNQGVSSGYEFLDSLQPSFLSVDTDGRVVRLDTFSKTIAPGCRLGWITASPAIIEKFIGVSESSTQQPSGFVQAMVAELVMGPGQPSSDKTKSHLSSLLGTTTKDQGWKKDGWVRWLSGLRGMYERRMTRMCRIIDSGAYLLKSSTPTSARDADWGVITKTQIFDYHWPRGGMFVWIKVLFETHPLWQQPWTSFVTSASIPSIYNSSESRAGGGAKKQDPALIGGPSLSAALMLYLTHKPHLVLVSTGALFSANETVQAEEGWRFFRLCFAAVGEEDVDATSKRFVEGVHAFWRVKDPRVIKKLLEPLTGGKAVATTAVSSFNSFGSEGGSGMYHQERRREEDVESVVLRKLGELDITGLGGC